MSIFAKPPIAPTTFRKPSTEVTALLADGRLFAMGAVAYLQRVAKDLIYDRHAARYPQAGDAYRDVAVAADWARVSEMHLDGDEVRFVGSTLTLGLRTLDVAMLHEAAVRCVATHRTPEAPGPAQAQAVAEAHDALDAYRRGKGAAVSEAWNKAAGPTMRCEHCFKEMPVPQGWSQIEAD